MKKHRVSIVCVLLASFLFVQDANAMFRRKSAEELSAVKHTFTDENGNVVTIDRSGQTVATQGKLQDTSEKEILIALADKIPEGADFNYQSAQRSGVVQPDEDVERQLVEKHREAQQQAQQMLASAAASANGDYSAAFEALGKAADLAKSLAEIRAKKNTPQKGDTSIIVTRSLSVGENSHLVAIESVDQFGQTIRHKDENRSNVKTSENINIEDVTRTEDLVTLFENAKEAYIGHELQKTERKKLELDAKIAELQKQKQKIEDVKNEPTAPAIPILNDSGVMLRRPANMSPNQWDLLQYGERNKAWGGNEDQFDGQADQLRWKEKEEGGTRLAVLHPNYFDKTAKAQICDMGHRVIENLSFWSRSNGFRPTFKASKSGSSYSYPLIFKTTSVNGVVRWTVVDAPNKANYNAKWTEAYPEVEKPKTEDPGISLPEIEETGQSGMHWPSRTLSLTPELNDALIRTPKFESKSHSEVGVAVSPGTRNMKDGKPASLFGQYKFSDDADPSREWAGIVMNFPDGTYKGTTSKTVVLERGFPTGEETLIIKP